MKFVNIGGCKLEVVRLPSAHPRDDARTLVFLHEGLGSVRMWRDFPQRVADATGCEVQTVSGAAEGGRFRPSQDGSANGRPVFSRIHGIVASRRT